MPLLGGSGADDWTDGTFTFDYNGATYRITHTGSQFDFNAGTDFHGIPMSATVGKLLNEDEQIYKTVATMTFQPDANSGHSAAILDTAAHLTPNALSLALQS